MSDKPKLNDAVYRSDVEAMTANISVLTQENQELRSEVERLQSLIDEKGNAIVYCPVDYEQEYEQETAYQNQTRLLLFAFAIQFAVFFIGASIVDSSYHYILFLAAIVSHIITVMFYLYRDNHNG
jgi:regulator of replication initiation timing